MNEKEISNKIDELINQLKKDLLNVPYNSRGVWDRVKNWWNNLTKTPNNPANPYYLTNKFGSLGKVNNTPVMDDEDNKNTEKEEDESEIPSEEEFKLGVSKNENRLSLQDYKILKEQTSLLDEKISFTINENYSSDNLKNLEMFRIIDKWAVNFKKQIMQILKGKINIESPTNNDDGADNLEEKKPIQNKQDENISFTNWIKDVENIHFFIEIVNEIFSDGVRYRKPLRSLVEVLKRRRVRSPKKGEEGTPLSVSIRSEILRMIKKEIDIAIKPEDSVFKPSVWAWAKNLPSWGRKKQDPAIDAEIDERPPAARSDEPPSSDFEEEDPSKQGEFLDI